LKKIHSYFLLLALVSSLFSCRKTETDPLISFRSREARVEGKWTVITYNSHITFQENKPGAIKYHVKVYIEGDNWVVNNNDNCFTVFKNNKWIYNFDGLGNFEMERAGKLLQECNNPISVDSVKKEVEKGYWNLAGGARNTKKKTELLLYTTNYSLTFGSYNTNSNNLSPKAMAWNIKTLKNKEMLLSYKNTFNTQASNNPGYTFEEEIEMLLIQK
jgi:hypothetical protein